MLNGVAIIHLSWNDYFYARNRDIMNFDDDIMDLPDNDENDEPDDVKPDVKLQFPIKRKRGRPPTGRKPRVYKETPGECDVCNKQFTRKRTMVEHMWRAHGIGSNPGLDSAPDKYGPYICEHCGDILSGKKSLKSHVRIKHPDQLPEEERDHFSCPDCGKYEVINPAIFVLFPVNLRGFPIEAQ